MIHFLHPEAWLLALPIALVLRRRLWPDRWLGVWRVALLTAALGLLAGPWWRGGVVGRDVVLVLDRSSSAPVGLLDRAAEVARGLVEQRQPGDRIGVVLAGRQPLVEQAPVEGYRWVPPVGVVDADGSDLGAAIEAALALVPAGRRGSVLLLSDGEHTAGDLDAVIARAQRRGVRVDVLPQRRPPGDDTAVLDVALPPSVGAGEPFQFSAWVRSTRARTATVRLRRDGAVIAEAPRDLVAGQTRLSFRDRLAEPGVHRYSVELVGLGDPVPENDRGRGVVTVAAPFRVLCITPDGRDDRFTAALGAAALDVVRAAPDQAPLHADALEGFRAVVLENVPAGQLPAGGLRALRQWVQHRGGGLLMTGGAQSFGAGGYLRSALEDVLPVSMEIRDEQRKFALAMAIALDVSGSMRAQVEGGSTKMELAVQGALAAVEVLGPLDAVAAFAVDTSAQEVVPLTNLSEGAEVKARIAEIRTGGGGIDIAPALEAAAAALAAAPHSTRHLVLFADASDAKNPGAFRDQLASMAADGITVSVIGLGSAKDSDAALLEEIARRGGGRIQFVVDAAELPRLFAEEAVQVTRSAMVEQPTPIAVLGGLDQIGTFPVAQFPDLGGYSVAWPKDGILQILETVDEQRAPAFSAWSFGLGRAAAFLGEVDGALTGDLGAWPGYAGFFGASLRWLGGQDASAEVYARMQRRGQVGVVDLEVEPGDEAQLAGARLSVLDPAGRAQQVALRWAGPQRRTATVPLPEVGVYRAVLALDGERFVRLPAVTVPVSAEFAPRIDPEEGLRVLTEIALATGGTLDPLAATWFDGPRDGRGVRDLGPSFAWLALLLLLGEIAFRRFRSSRRDAGGATRRRWRPEPKVRDRAATPPPEQDQPADRGEGVLDILDRMRDRG